MVLMAVCIQLPLSHFLFRFGTYMLLEQMNKQCFIIWFPRPKSSEGDRSIQTERTTWQQMERKKNTKTKLKSSESISVWGKQPKSHKRITAFSRMALIDLDSRYQENVKLCWVSCVRREENNKCEKSFGKIFHTNGFII